MNPFLYKPHPLMQRLLGLLFEPQAQSLDGVAGLVLLMLGLNCFWALGLIWAARSVDRLRLPLRLSYGLALPACLLYTPLALTIVSDVAVHGFRFQERFLLVFALLVVTQILAAFYAFMLRHRPSGYAVGLQAGLAVSLFLLLLGLPISLGVMGLDAAFKLF